MAITVGQPIVASDFVSTSAGAGDEGKVPKLNASGVLDDSFLSAEVHAGATFISMDGSTTPIPVAIQSDGTFAKSDANGSPTTLRRFNGFVTDNITALSTSAVNNGQTTGFSGSVTANAGTDRVLLVGFAIATGSAPSAVTWNGISGVNIANVTSTNRIMSVWRFTIGTSGSNQTYSLVPTGGSGTVVTYYTTHGYVNQASPVADSDTQTSGSTSANIDTTTTPTEYRQAVVGFAAFSNNAASFVAGISDVQDSATVRSCMGQGFVLGATATTVSLDGDGGTSIADVAIVVVALKNSSSTAGNITVGGILGGFTGLTPGASYYVSDTEGTLSATPGTATVLVGKALSATQLLIVHS